MATAGQSDNPVTYAWYSSADNYANPIGSGPTYLVNEGDESFTIEVKATATNDNGVTASATGAARLRMASLGAIMRRLPKHHWFLIR